MDLLKIPYEISLWDDVLTWVRLELEPIKISAEDYKPGEYYCQTPNVYGAIPYTLSYDGYIDSQRYYKVKESPKKLEGDNVDIGKLEEEQQAKWKNQQDMYQVIKVGENFENNKTYYVYNRDEDKFYTLESLNLIDKKPQPGQIYFEKIPVGEGYIPSTVLTYYKETKLCTIGSHTMDSLARCINPKLVRKVNGENILTFTMYYHYTDIETGKKEYNPFNKYMVNERKVKLWVGGKKPKWYDFIIKQIQENSESCAFTYTCKDQFVNELSKTGFEIVLDNELENNMGTVDQLAGYILEGSDWQVQDVEPLKQYIEEPLYEITISAALEGAKVLETGKPDEIINNWENDFVEEGNLKLQHIYVFYSQLNNKEESLQFLYSPNDNFTIDDDRIIDKTIHLNYLIENVNYDDEGKPTFAYKVEDEDGKPRAVVNLSYNFRGNRLVEQTQTKYDSTIDKYVSVYTKAKETYHCFEETKYISPSATLNYVANPTNFTNTTGWRVDDHDIDLSIKTYPEEYVPAGEYESFLYFKQTDGAWVLNEGIGGNRTSIQEFKENDEYVLRIKYKVGSTLGAFPENYSEVAPEVEITTWNYSVQNGNEYFSDIEDHFRFEEWNKTIEINDGEKPIYTNDVVVNNNVQEYAEPEHYVYLKAKCIKPLSKEQLQNWDRRLGLFFYFSDSIGKEIYIEDVQLFPYLEFTDENGKTRFSVPGGKLFSEVKTQYIFYKPDPTLESIDQLQDKIVYKTLKEAKNNGFEPFTGGENRFIKIRSISAKESNRFNLLQELCETFECWLKMNIQRDETSGAIALDENYRQIKKIGFGEYVGKPNYAGFRYGINSKSIQRTLDSAAIVSKMIVKDNSNEHAPSGFCSIAQASENPTGENFLLSFDHYIRQKLLDLSTVTNDLYLEDGGYLGYYKILKRLNKDRDINIDIQAGLLKDMAQYEATYTTQQTAYNSAEDDQPLVERDILQYTGSQGVFSQVIGGLLEQDKWKNDNKFNSYWTKWCRLETVKKQTLPLAKAAKANLKEAETKYDEITAYLKELANKKRALNLQFYKKYSRFLQEGSWIKEDYVDPNLYYMDSESTLHTSAQPKVTYNISVVDVSPLKDYEKYDFDIGDKTFIEDPEFFGWSLIDGTTPYREEIIVSEITTELDSPEKNQIKVQNYKTQFEDLFQRITATTQQAEYHTGEYNRAAAVIETNGTIKVETLENSFANNEIRLSNARDQSVVWDETGITTWSLSNPTERVRIVSGGIFLSNDGGRSWKTGITSQGINTTYLTAGQLNVEEIYIMAGSHPSFGWDSRGLSAYCYTLEDGQPQGFNLNQFVRFDHNGIYGIKNADGLTLDSELDIWNNAHFALTWKGFMLKNDEGSVSITSEDDIQVFDGGSVERIKIGRITEDDTTTYGIRISKNQNGKRITVMETDDEGELWLRKELHVGTEDTSMVRLGYLDDAANGVHEVIHAGDDAGDGAKKNFIVYEDGTLSAAGVNIKGVITATGGQIGNMSIAAVEKAAYEVVITSNTGVTAHQGEVVELTATLFLGGEEYTGTIEGYQWYKISEPDNVLGDEKKYLINGVEFNQNGYVQYGCKITIPSQGSELNGDQ